MECGPELNLKATSSFSCINKQVCQEENVLDVAIYKNAPLLFYSLVCQLYRIVRDYVTIFFESAGPNHFSQKHLVSLIIKLI